MLQQILRDLYVDPEILSELDEQQKQTLFCKMREEQVRRWTIWDDKLIAEKPKTPDRKLNRKTVTFLKGTDGEPWVWVMGEHENDKTIEQILKEEAMEKARKLAEKEAEEMRKHVEAELKLSEYIDLTPKIEDDIYCSVDELREKIISKPLMKNLNNYTINHYQTKNNKYSVIDTRDVLNELSMNTQVKVAQKVALWEKRLTEERTCEILKKMEKKKKEEAKEAEELEIKQEQLWKEQGNHKKKC